MDLNRLSTLLRALGSPHEFLVQEFKTPAVYHYTDLNAMRSIVSNEDLWLTNSRFSNDYEEGEYGEKVVTQAIQARIEQAEVSSDERQFAMEVGKKLKSADDLAAYVCCFCLEDDL